jgi:hypothetical protein
MNDTMRSCSRTGCRWPAAACFSFRYSSRQVWLLDLAAPDPALYDLCPHHADTLIVPKGWVRVDQRTITPAVHEPSGSELVQRAAERGSGVDPEGNPDPARVNRYEHLFSELPKLAAEVAERCAANTRTRPDHCARSDVGGGVIVPIQTARRSGPKV